MTPEPDQGPAATTVRYWVAGCSVSEDLWRYRRDSKTVTCDARGRYLQGKQGELVWPDYVLATEIDSLTLQGEGLEELRFTLFWSADDAFTAARSIEPVADRSRPGEVRFELAGLPEWQGRIRRFRLTWSGAATSNSRVLAAWATKRAAAARS